MTDACVGKGFALILTSRVRQLILALVARIL